MSINGFDWRGGGHLLAVSECQDATCAQRRLLKTLRSNSTQGKPWTSSTSATPATAAEAGVAFASDQMLHLEIKPAGAGQESLAWSAALALDAKWTVTKKTCLACPRGKTSLPGAANASGASSANTRRCLLPA